MVAYNFQPRFIEPIRASAKRQTIRADRKRHARPGETLQLYTGMRTRQCELIGRSVCAAVRRIRITFADAHIEIDGRTVVTYSQVELRHAFAQADGFQNWWDFRCFWRDHHPEIGALDAFEGVLIEWGELLPTDDA